MRIRTAAIVLAVASALAVVGLTLPATSAADTTVHFTAAGDYNSTAATTNVLNLIAAQAPDLNLALGDLSYGPTGQEQAWCDLVTGRVGAGFPFELISGNHESDGSLNGNINDFSACLPNQMPGLVGTYGRQWYVDVPRSAPLVRFVMISPALTYPDGVWSYTAGSARYNWTVAAIDSARAAGIHWVVVGMHKPCLSLGEYPCEPGAALMNMLISKNVDLVLTGHEHGYQRTKQLRLKTGCSSVVPGSFNAACVQDSDDSLVQGQGTVFATVGTGGTPLRDMNASDPEVGYFRSWSGLNTSPSYGILDVSATADALTARFLPTSGGSLNDSFVIDRNAVNQPPVAAFTSSTNGLTASFDGTGSSDPDGSVSSYAWDFGDGSTGSGATPSHAYPVAGDYSVILTVTDNLGSATSVTHVVSVAPTGGTTPFVSDAFSRTVTNGLGSADVGGPWSLIGAVTNFGVSSGTANFTLRTPSTQTAGYLGSTLRTDSDVTLTLSADTAATGGGVYNTIVGRRVGANNEYSGRVKLLSGGSVAVALTALKGSATTTVLQGDLTLPGLTYSPGMRLNVRLQVTGTNPTSLRMKAWPVGMSEPTTWQRSVTDTAAALQAAGSVGFTSYLSSSSTTSPVVVRIDDLAARPTAGP
jgi:PKD repeat protein